MSEWCLLMVRHRQAMGQLQSHFDDLYRYTRMECAMETYRKISNISCTNHKNLNVSHIVLQLSLPGTYNTQYVPVFTQSIEDRYQVEDEDVVGAAPTGDAPTTSDRSEMLLPTKVWLISDDWREMLILIVMSGWNPNIAITFCTHLLFYISSW